MYKKHSIVRGFKNPKIIASELNRLYHRRLNTADYNTDGVDFMSEDWDVMIILDACRFDTFKDQNGIEGDLQMKTSRGSNTKEFLVGNFAGRDFPDTVYVTANPQLQWNDIKTGFHHIENIWQGDGWNEQLGTVHPNTMSNIVKDLADRYRNKRFIVHFMQPHCPFVGNDLTRIAFTSNEKLNFWQQKKIQYLTKHPRLAVSAA
jgi:hypothetical protein